MTTVKKVSIVGSLLVIILVGGYGLYEWISQEELKASTIFYVCIGIGFLFQSLTWGEINGKYEEKKDDLEKQITFLSAKISYYILFVLMILVLFVSERVFALDAIDNIPLVIVIGLAWITLPITEFVVSKKYN